MSELLFSVIIPTYNRKELLRKAIMSVQAQSVLQLEILVCDDGSDDGTVEMVKVMSNADPRIILIECGHNGWPAIPRNIGIKKARAKWVAFLDDDDCWIPSKLEKQLATMARYDVMACCTNAFQILDKEDSRVPYFKDEGIHLYSYRDMISVNPIICSSMVVRKSLFDKCCGFPEGCELKAVGEDYALWCRVVAFTKILYIGNPLVEYSMKTESSIRLSKSDPFDIQRRIIVNDLHKWLSDKSIIIKYYYLKEEYFYLKNEYKKRLKLRVKHFRNRIISEYGANKK